MTPLEAPLAEGDHRGEHLSSGPGAECLPYALRVPELRQ